MAERLENIVINVDFERKDSSTIIANEIQVVPGNIAWEDFELMLKIYSDQERITVYYADDDNDTVLIESEEELQEAFKVARKCKNLLKLLVVSDGLPCPPDLLDNEKDQLTANPDPDPDVSGQFLAMVTEHPYFPGGPGDTWMLADSDRNGAGSVADQTDYGSFFVSSDDDDDDGGESRDEGSDKKEKINNHDDDEEVAKEYFFIQNMRCQSKVLDVEAFKTEAGTNVIVYDQKPIKDAMNQLWYRHSSTSTIRTFLNDYCLDVIDGRVVIIPYIANKTSQMWLVESNELYNKYNCNWVIGVKNTDPQSCDQVFAFKREELANTGWIISNAGDVSTIFSQESKSNVVEEKSRYFHCSFSRIPRRFRLPTRAGSNKSEQGDLLHGNIICDNCNVRIRGVRYKCGFCDDYDLCIDCESISGVHDLNHLLLKMNVPVDSLLFKYNVIEHVLKKKEQEHKQIPSSQMNAACRKIKKWQKDDEKQVRKIEKREEKVKRQREKHRKPLDAEIVCDMPFPGGHTETTVIKKWLLKNTGIKPWTSEITLIQIRGNVNYTIADINCSDIRGLAPGHSEHVAVHLLKPLAEGKCDIAWRLYDNDELFGPSLKLTLYVADSGMTIAVIPFDDQLTDDCGESVELLKQNLDAAATTTEDEMRASAVNDDEGDTEADDQLMVVPDIVCFDDDKLNRQSDTLTVPTNTPLADTPPYTPAVEDLDGDGWTIGSASHHPDDASTASSLDYVNMAVMADLVHEKMSELVMNGEYDYINGRGSDSDGSHSSSNCSDDFYIVPIPDCFNPSLPPRKEASTTVVVKKSGLKNQRVMSVDEMLKTSNFLATEPLLSPVACFSNASFDDSEESISTDNDTKISEHDCTITVTMVETNQELNNGTRTNDENVAPVHFYDAEEVDGHPTINLERGDDDDDDDAAGVLDENSNTEVDVNQNEMDRYRQQDNESTTHDDVNDSTEDVNENRPNDTTEDDDLEPDGATAASAANVEASTLKLMSSVFSFVVKTAKDVYYTLQEKNNYEPPKSDWCPPANNTWTPSDNKWTPPQQPAWSPPAEQWMPHANSRYVPPVVLTDPNEGVGGGERSAMEQLIDMGFGNRQLNQQLLQSSDNNIEFVIQKLIEMNENWR